MTDAAPASAPARGRRQPARWLVIALVVAVPLALIVWLAAPRHSCACIPTASPQAVTSPVDGVVVAVDATGLTRVNGFTLRTSRGLAIDFKLGALENATQFTPSHLAEHQATSVPVRVFFLDQDGQHVVYRLEDAPT